MTSPKAPPMTDEPEVVKRVRDFFAASQLQDHDNTRINIADLRELLRLAAAPRAGVVESMRYALRRAGDFVDDEIHGRTEAGGEETDYVLEAEAVRDVINGALALAAPPAVPEGSLQNLQTTPDPHAELVAPFKPTHRHVKRGTEYEVLGTARIQTSQPLVDEEVVIVYQNREGLTWVRPPIEFNDGRFESLSDRDGGAE